MLLNAACFIHRRFQSFPGRWRLAHWLDRQRSNFHKLSSGPKSMGHGMTMYLALDDVHDGQKYFVYGFNTREPLGNLMCQAMRPGDSALDIGANAGYFTAMLSLVAGRQGRVFTFEAAPGTYERLKTVVKNNPHENVHAFHCAVSDSIGSIQLSLGPTDHTGISSIRSLDRHGGTVTVPSLTIDSLLADLPKIRLAKIDVEGAEMLVLRGMDALIERDRPHLFVEVTDPFLRSLGSSKHELVSHVLAKGYTAFRVGRQVEPYVHCDEYQCDVLFVPHGEAALAFDERLTDFAKVVAR
jgi:FkbM family methyltransferase